VRDAARDWRTYTSSVVGVTAIPVITPRVEPQLPIEVDPPDHSTYRLLMNPVFAPARVAELKQEVFEVAREALDRAIADPAPDLVRDYAAPVALRTLAIFTGLPADDAPRWAAWIRRMFDIISAPIRNPRRRRSV
jgi:cytochrome P450